MEKKIDIAELLKDCPSGMELDCTMFENVTFEGIKQDEYPIIVKIKEPSISLSLTKTGGWNLYNSAKCVIFPKGKNTWEGFQRPFKDGDVVYAIDEGNEYIFIFKEIYENERVYCYLNLKGGDLRIQEVWLTDYNPTHRLATEEEKQKLFDSIKANGYEWNPETKTLKKLHKFKDGDIVTCTNSACTYTAIFKEMIYNGAFHHYGILVNNRFRCRVNDWSDFNETCRLATEEEKQKLFQAIKNNGYRWNPETKTLEKLPKTLPKFKVGDRIRYKADHKFVFTITSITKDKYECGKTFALRFTNQDEYELVPNKFDITTLKPFESKVLVRDIDTHNWIGSFYSHYEPNGKKFYIMGGSYYLQCIPYEGNEHLLDTSNDCEEFYKTWK